MELKAEVLALSEKLADTEGAGDKWDKAISRLETIADTHAAHLIDINHHLEDLDK